MKEVISPAQRLIVAADFPVEATGRDGLYRRVRFLAEELKNVGCLMKVNSLLRARGYGVINDLRSLGFGCFADLKLYDIKETLKNDGALLKIFGPDFVTVSAFAGEDALKALKDELPDTKVLLVAVLTSLTDKDLEQMYGFKITMKEAQSRMLYKAAEAGLDGVICAPGEARDTRSLLGKDMEIITPNVRFADEIVLGDDQNPSRSMTPDEAMHACANRVVMGRPITQAANPYEAAMRAIHLMSGIPHYA